VKHLKTKTDDEIILLPMFIRVKVSSSHKDVNGRMFVELTDFSFEDEPISLEEFNPVNKIESIDIGSISIDDVKCIKPISSEDRLDVNAYYAGHKVILKPIKTLQNSALSQELEYSFLSEIYGYCELETTFYVVWESFNLNLKDLLHDKTLDWVLKYSIAKDIAKGLSYLHKKKIIHGDLRSTTILITDEKKAKLSEYGIYDIIYPKFSGYGKEGSFRYMAPELIKSMDSERNEQTDIYSFGMVMWELGTHKIPFEDSTDFQIFPLLFQNQKEIVSPETHPNLNILIEKCWETEPSKRPTLEDCLTQIP